MNTSSLNVQLVAEAHASFMQVSQLVLDWDYTDDGFEYHQRLVRVSNLLYFRLARRKNNLIQSLIIRTEIITLDYTEPSFTPFSQLAAVAYFRDSEAFKRFTRFFYAKKILLGDFAQPPVLSPGVQQGAPNYLDWDKKSLAHLNKCNFGIFLKSDFSAGHHWD